MPAKSVAIHPVAALEAKTFFFQCYQDEWTPSVGVIEGQLIEDVSSSSITGHELQKISEAERSKKAVEVTITGSEALVPIITPHQHLVWRWQTRCF